MTSAARIKARLATSRFLDNYRRKAHDLRKIVAGDYSRVDPEAPSQIDVEVPPDQERVNLSELYDIMTVNFEEGSSNLMLKSIRGLTMQVSFKFPSIEFQEVSPLEADVMSLYLKARLGFHPRGCDAADQMRLALLDYIISGLGWVWCGIQMGKPVVKYVDSLDVSWDLGAKIVTDIRWVSVRVKEPLAYWIELFGKKAFADECHAGGDDDAYLEKTIELMFYFDVEGDKGTSAVFRSKSNGVTGDPIELTDNPYTIEIDGYPKPFLPLEPIYYMTIPSVRNPVGLAEMMLPHQLATREAEKYMRTVIKRGAPWVDVVDGTYDEDELEKLEAGEAGAIITRKKESTSSAEIKQPLSIPKEIAQYYEHNEQELIGQGGNNPYAFGKVDGVSYASEVHAIEGNAGLTAANLATDHGGHYVRVVKKTLANAVKYDDMPIVLIYDETKLAFGPSDPIGKYLRPDAVPVIAEDSLMFEPREKRIERSLALLKVAQSVYAIAPQSLTLAYEEVLRAFGVQNVKEHFEPPVGGTGAPPPPGSSAGAPAEAGAAQG